jgi:hypothetical protein
MSETSHVSAIERALQTRIEQTKQANKQLRKCEQQLDALIQQELKQLKRQQNDDTNEIESDDDEQEEEEDDDLVKLGSDMDQQNNDVMIDITCR